MQTNHHSKKITLVQQACETVPGFKELCQRFKQKISISGKAHSTFINYSRHLAVITLYYNRLPTSLTSGEIDEFLYHIQQKFNSPSETYFKHIIFSLRFIFRMEDLPEMRIQLPKIKYPKRLPVVLSKVEMVDMLNKPRLLKHRLLIALLYGCGLRCAEVRNIKLNDLDFHRSMLHVRQGKGNKDRYMPLGDFLVAALINYIDTYQPQTWLFDAKRVKGRIEEFDKKFSQRGVQWAIHEAAKLAGITKNINVHSLRHTFATHLLEDGLDIISIKELLGHASIETTLIYLHVAQFDKKRKYSPIDNLQGVRINHGIQCKIDFSYT